MFDRIDQNRMIGYIEWENDDGDMLETAFPLKFEVCGCCQGKGRYCNPAIDGNGLTREDFDQDPDFEESYFNGDYDITCEECHGDRVVLVPSLEEKDYSGEQKEAIDRFYYLEQCRAEDAHTMRMERGGY